MKRILTSKAYAFIVCTLIAATFGVALAMAATTEPKAQGGLFRFFGSGWVWRLFNNSSVSTSSFITARFCGKPQGQRNSGRCALTCSPAWLTYWQRSQPSSSLTGLAANPCCWRDRLHGSDVGAMAVVFGTAGVGADGKPLLNHTAAVWELISANLYIVAFGVSWGPVMWVLLGEMFPNQLREAALAVSGATNSGR